MVDSRLELAREIELPPVVVWDALVDVDLVSGWWGAARIDPVAGGEYRVTPLDREGLPVIEGSIVEIDRPRQLALDSSAGAIVFRLAELPGGLRGTSTRLHVTIETNRDAADTVADWSVRLDQLEALLRGIPADWRHWELERRSSWEQYRRRQVDSAG